MSCGVWDLCCEACVVNLTWMNELFTVVYGVYVTSRCDKTVRGMNVHAGEVYVLGAFTPSWIARCLEDKR